MPNGLEAQQPTGKISDRLFGPGFINVALCHALLLPFITLPLSTYFAARFGSCHGRELIGHYHYIRTTVAIMLLGGGTAALCLLVGVETSARLVLAGLVVGALTLVLFYLRCLYGIACALRRKPLRNHRSLLV